MELERMQENKEKILGEASGQETEPYNDYGNALAARNSQFACPLCPFTAGEKRRLRLHLKLDHGDEVEPRELVYACSVCLKVFASKIAVTQHLKNHPREREYSRAKGILLPKAIQVVSAQGFHARQGPLQALASHRAQPAFNNTCLLLPRDFRHPTSLLAADDSQLPLRDASTGSSNLNVILSNQMCHSNFSQPDELIRSSERVDDWLTDVF